MLVLQNRSYAGPRRPNGETRHAGWSDGNDANTAVTELGVQAVSDFVGSFVVGHIFAEQEDAIVPLHFLLQGFA